MASNAYTVKEIEEKLFKDFDGEDNLSELNSDFEFEDEQPHLRGSRTAVLDMLVPEALIDNVQISDEDVNNDDNDEIISPCKR